MSSVKPSPPPVSTTKITNDSRARNVMCLLKLLYPINLILKSTEPLFFTCKTPLPTPPSPTLDSKFLKTYTCVRDFKLVHTFYSGAFRFFCYCST